MKKALTILAGVLLFAACVQLPDILETGPVKTAPFDGSQTEMAQCVKLALPGGKVQVDPISNKIDVFDSKKGWDYIGVTHYAVSVYPDGRIELRKLPEGELTEEANKRLWLPIENCIKTIEASS